uniref:Uncharacterized protein n=1 Tax=Physcomitrium patens TaxID=3218 RepID=A0A7I4BJF8_PHYPA
MRIYKPGTRTGGRCCTRTLFVTNCVVIVCNTLSVVYYVYESVVNPALQQHEPSTPQLFPKKIGSSLLSLGSVPAATVVSFARGLAFSVSGKTGQSILDETPRAACCKVKVYHTANFTRCNYALSYCNSSETMVYGEPLPPSLAAQIQPWTSREELKWFWQTSPSCPMLPFDRQDFCKRIERGQHLLISRDSINYQLFITFHNFLRSELSEIQYPFHGVGFEPVCKDVLGGEGFNLAWVCSPLLNTTEVTHYIEEWKIEIIFMNRGAWFRSDSSFFNELKEIAKVLQMRYPPPALNTSPRSYFFSLFRIIVDESPGSRAGHKGCVDLHKPLKQPQDKSSLPYHWGEFARQNELAKRTVHRAHFIFLDPDTMLSL